MLRPASKEEIERYLDYAYELSQDFSKSAFPTYLDEIKTKEDFIEVVKGADDGCSEILLFIQERVVGWIQYYWLEEDSYIGFDIFNTESDTGEAIDEFLEYVKDRFAGYQINFGFPVGNRQAIRHLEGKKGFVKSEDSFVYVLHFDDYQIKEIEGDIVAVGHDNWNDFKTLHDQDPDMYWNSERLHDALEGKTKHPWHMYIYYRDTKPVGTIYFTYVRNMMEIFGMDFKDGRYDAAAAANLMKAALNTTKQDGIKDMTYFAIEEERTLMEELGMRFITEYVLYWNKGLEG